MHVGEFESILGTQFNTLINQISCPYSAALTEMPNVNVMAYMSADFHQNKWAVSARV